MYSAYTLVKVWPVFFFFFLFFLFPSFLHRGWDRVHVRGETSRVSSFFAHHLLTRKMPQNTIQVNQKILVDDNWCDLIAVYMCCIDLRRKTCNIALNNPDTVYDSKQKILIHIFFNIFWSNMPHGKQCLATG